MANDPSGMFRDLMSTIEEKVNKPLAQSSGKLTSEFFSDPGAYRQKIQQQNVGNPLDPLQIDKLVGQRRGNIAGQLELNQGLAGANTDILGNFFNFVSNLAEQSRLSQSAGAKKSNLQLVETAKGLRSYDPETGQFVGDVLGQSPQDQSDYTPADIDSFVVALQEGQIKITSVPQSIRSAVLAKFNQSQGGQQAGGLSQTLQGIPLIGGLLSKGAQSIGNFFGGG